MFFGSTSMAVAVENLMGCFNYLAMLYGCHGHTSPILFTCVSKVCL
jgi:hypothetical protein